MKPNKYRYIRVIQGYFGYHGWEDLSEYDKNDKELLKHDLKEYRFSSHHPYRVITRRVLNEQNNQNCQ